MANNNKYKNNSNKAKNAQSNSKENAQKQQNSASKTQSNAGNSAKNSNTPSNIDKTVAQNEQMNQTKAAKLKPTNPQESESNNAEKLDDSKNPKSKQSPTHFWWLDAIYFILGTLALGGIASLLGGKMFDFNNYTMPPLTAPAWLFPIAWTIIYISIGVATFLMWRDKQITSGDRKFNLILYFIHMAFNITWPLIFFRCNMPILACVWLGIIVVLALITTWRYFVANIPSGIIFCLYVIWLIYAFYLNLGVCLLA